MFGRKVEKRLRNIFYRKIINCTLFIRTFIVIKIFELCQLKKLINRKKQDSTLV